MIKAQLYEEIKTLRTTETFLHARLGVFPTGYIDALIERKVKTMQKIGELNRKLYGRN